jgi:endosialidase-like protein
MNTAIRHAALAAGLAIAFAAPAALAAEFNYHGSLRDGAQPAEGRYDLRVTLYGGEHAVAPAAAPVTLYGVDVHEGRFSTAVDFAQDAPADAWLAVAVRRAGSGEFVELTGRSAITGAEACWSTVGNTGLTGGDFLGTLDNIPLVMRTNDQFAGAFRPFADGVSFEMSKATASAARAAALNWGLASAVDSFAGGYSGQVPAGHDRSFVWGGTNRVTRVSSTGADQFDVWADGGFVVNSSALTAGADDMVIYPRGGSGADSDSDLVLVAANGNYARLYESNGSGILHLFGTSGVHIDNPVSIEGELKVAGGASKATAGAWQANSDGRIKQDIAPVADALDTLGKVRPVTFRYTDAYRAEHPGVADQRYYNVIAQEFATVFPDAVTRSGEYLPGTAPAPENEILQVDTYPAQIVTIAAVQELAQKNERLEDTVARLSARLARLEAAKGK